MVVRSLPAKLYVKSNNFWARITQTLIISSP